MSPSRAAVEWVPVSPEMTTIIGDELPHCAALPGDVTSLLAFSLGTQEQPASLHILAQIGDWTAHHAAPGSRTILCIVTRHALGRLFGWSASGMNGKRYHLGSELRSIALSIADAPMDGPPRETYRIGKSIELLCETMRALTADSLVPLEQAGSLTLADSRRVIKARRMIDEHWADKLTLDTIARKCGLNRAKLTRGFRELYKCSVAEAITERRLTEARRQLLTTDLPVSSIGYASGYLNNASFTRAFGRRFGVSPTACRSRHLAVA